MNDLWLVLDGIKISAVDVFDDLPRSVIISLFTWRRANPDDALPSNSRQGWWGDTYPVSANDRIGSRLWLLSRSVLTVETVTKAKEYAEEALQWLVDDGVAASVAVIAERNGIDRLDIGVTITRGDAGQINIRFTNVWDYLHAI